MPSAAGASQKHIVHVCGRNGEGRGGQRVDAEKGPWERRASARSEAEETKGCLHSRPPRRRETRAGRDTRARWRFARVSSRTFSSDAAMPGASPAPRALGAAHCAAGRSNRLRVAVAADRGFERLLSEFPRVRVDTSFESFCYTYGAVLAALLTRALP